MTGSTVPQGPDPSARVLIISMIFAPCREVGGKRFSYLSQYLSREFAEYHVLARKERETFNDPTAFRGNVHRARMFPYYPPKRSRGILHKLSRFWVKWLCQVDPYIGWVIPAIFSGIRLCRQYRLNVVIVTVPSFSSIIAALAVSKVARCKLIIDYRDEWTNHKIEFRRPFGKYICPALERTAIKRASAVVVCTEIMRTDFVSAFGEFKSTHIELIYNGYDAINDEPPAAPKNPCTTMMYAGTLYGKRQITLIAPALLELLHSGEISADSFRLHVYSRLRPEQIAEIERSGIRHIVEVHEPVSYATIQRVMRESDILFLPSGDEFNYAIPFKFYDYLSARRPILAVASKASAVREVMTRVHCGEFAEIGHADEIVLAIKSLLRNERKFSFQGAERFEWPNAASQYVALINKIMFEVH